MKTNSGGMHHMAAVMIDVLLAILLLLAFFFVNATVKPGPVVKTVPRVSARAAQLPAVNYGPRLGRTAPPVAATKASVVSVRYEGGRLVPVLAQN